MLESKSNAQIKKIQKLKKSARFRRQESLFVVEGWKMVEEALSRNMIQKLYVSTKVENEYRAKLQGFYQRPAVDERPGLEQLPVGILSESLFRELSDTITPQGVMALVKMPHYEREQLMSPSEAALLCLEDIQDPGNLGTMIRTAEGAGMAGVVLSKGCVDLFNPKVVRSTMGALFRVPFYLCENLSTEVEYMKKEGFTMYAAHLQGKCCYTESAYKGRVGILIGNEAGGLSEEMASLADVKMRIPMEGELESLNAAVSAALLMYEVRRNRR